MNYARLNSLFDKCIAEDRVFHSYIIEDSREEKSVSIAMRFVQSLMCIDETKKPCGICGGCRKVAERTHEDVLWISKEKSVLTEDVYNIQKHLATKSFAGRYRTAVVEKAETMTQAAQDKLLKTLEEPPERSLIILITLSAEKLLHTVVSRCITYTLTESEGLDTIGSRDYGDVSGFLSALLSNKPFYVTSRMAEKYLSSSESTLDFLMQLKLLAREMLLTGRIDAVSASSVIVCAETAELDIRAKLKPGNVIKNMILSIEIERKTQHSRVR